MRSSLRICCVAIAAILLAQLIAVEAEASLGQPFAHRASLGRALHRKALLGKKTPVGSSGYSYKTMWFTQFVDHFNFKNSMATFQQRYLINTDSWQVPSAENNYTAGPLFFYTGNEGDVVEFAENTGFMWEIAPRFNAMIIFAEHRYYGETMPLGNMSFANPDNLQYLTANQALADFAVLINALKAQYLPPQSQGLMPVIAFGGSYGGMLTAWMREKYPHIVIGGIAASAPIWQFEGLVSAESYSSICSHDFAYYGSACSDGIAKSWGILNSWAATPIGLAKINSIFAPCQQFASAADVSNQLFPFLGNALSTLPMGNYPYPTTFLGPMPGWPVQVACSYFSAEQSDNDNIIALKNAISVYYNYTGEAGTCFQMSSPGPSSLAEAGGWAYQSCNEMVMPIGQDGVHDIFYPAVWNLTATIANCQATYGITPRPYWIPTQFGSWDLARSGVTNIVFSNGDMDPWSGGGVLTNLSDSLVAVKIHLGAHHLDLRSSNPADPESVVYARQLHVAYIQKWINEYYALSSRPTPFPAPCPGCPECAHCGGKLSTTKVVVIACFATAAALGMATGCFWYFWNDVKHKRQQQWQQEIATHSQGDAQPTSDQRYAELHG